MKMRKTKINIFAMTLILATIALIQVSCEKDWEKPFKSSELLAPSTATVSVSSIADSSAVIDYSLSSVGRLYLAVIPGTEESTLPEQDALLKLNAEGNVFIQEVIFDNAGTLNGNVKVSGLIQNTSYKVYALPVNSDGVKGDVVTTTAFITGDTHAPELDLSSGITPGISSSPAQEKGFEIELAFNEPVMLGETVSIEMGFMDASTGAINTVVVPVANISVSSNVVKIMQPETEVVNGQYVFLSVANNSIKDLAGNSYAGVTSGVDGGYLVGIYWRIVYETLAADILPAEDVTSDLTMPIVLDFGVPMSIGDYDQTTVVARYTSEGITTDVEIPEDYVYFDGNMVYLYSPRTPSYGETLTFKIAEGAVENEYGSPNAAIEFGEKEWFFSYGYERSLILGDYTIGGIVSYWDGALADTYSVTISEDPSDAGKVLISGFMGSQDDIVADFNGDFATLTIYAGDDGYGQLLTFPAGHPYEAYQFELWNPIDGGGVGTIVAGIDANGSLYFTNFGMYYYTDGADGWFDIWTQSTWTKNVVKKTNVSSVSVFKPKGEGLGKDFIK